MGSDSKRAAIVTVYLDQQQLYQKKEKSQHKIDHGRHETTDEKLMQVCILSANIGATAIECQEYHAYL